jgi:hypothetical protein
MIQSGWPDEARWLTRLAWNHTAHTIKIVLDNFMSIFNVKSYFNLKFSDVKMFS